MNFSKFNSNSSLNHFLDGFLNSTIGDFVGSDVIATHPRVNITEQSNNFEIELAAPGLNKSDFNISVENNSLKISVKKKEASKEGSIEKEYRRREYSFVSFERNFLLPENVESRSIDASYEDGILCICLPKVENKKQEIKTIVID